MNEYRLEFHDALAELQTDVARLGQMAAEMVARSTVALLEHNLTDMKDVIASDDAVDRLALDIEERCYRLLALQNPIATDLRVIIASQRMSIELERSADLATNICKGARRIFDVDLDARSRGLIESMSKEAVMMLGHATQAYCDRDSGLAAALDDIDDRLDDLQVELVESIFTAHREGTIGLSEAVQLALICRYYERIGDHAVNMGERVVYLVTGWLPEHNSIAREEMKSHTEQPEVAEEAATPPGAVDIRSDGDDES